MTHVSFASRNQFADNCWRPGDINVKNDQLYGCLASCHSACLLDVAFIIDHSGSVRRSNWVYVIDFMVSFVSSVNVGPDGSNVGAVSFGVYFALQL